MKLMEHLEERLACTREMLAIDVLEREHIGPADVDGWIELEVLSPEDLPELCRWPRTVHYRLLGASSMGWRYLFWGPVNQLCGVIKEGWDSGDEGWLHDTVCSIEVGDPPPPEPGVTREPVLVYAVAIFER